MDTIDLVIKSANSFYKELQADANGRYRSWEHCYKCFHEARNDRSPDYDYLSLQLAFYLASWGMYRASTFLFQKDYKVHIPVVKELLQEKYDCLFGLACTDLREQDVQKKLSELEKFIEKHYGDMRKSVKEREVKKKVSDTLKTKILMGTLGCVPAYDNYFTKSIKDLNVSTGNCNLRSLLRLADFYQQHSELLEKARQKMKVCDGLIYPQMKLLDMGFWQIGIANDSK